MFFIKTLKAFILVLTISFGSYVNAEYVDQDLAEAIITKGKSINTISTTSPLSKFPSKATFYHMIYKNKIYICMLAYGDKKREDGSGRSSIDLSRVYLQCSNTK